MGEVKYVSRVRIERIRGPLRRATLPAEREPVFFGVHDQVAEHYAVAAPGDAEHAATLDYIVAAAGGWLTGTFGGALEARQIDASGGRLVGEATGEVEVEDGVLVIKRIHVRYLLQVDPAADRVKIERAFEHHMERCPVYRSIGAAVDCTTELELVDAWSGRGSAMVDLGTRQPNVATAASDECAAAVAGYDANGSGNFDGDAEIAAALAAGAAEDVGIVERLVCPAIPLSG